MTRPSAVRVAASALAGILLLGAGLFEAYNLIERVYYDYIFYPKVKEGYIMPTRWQDFVGTILLWGGTALLLYLSYRLLMYGFRKGPIGAVYRRDERAAEKGR